MVFKVKPEPPTVPPLTQAQPASPSSKEQKRKKKKPIPKAMREQIWIREFGKVFDAKCKTTWCQNIINAWDFQAGHDIPESKGGKTEPGNLVPICARCNLSMSDTYTFKEWNAMSGTTQTVPLAPPPGRWCC
jgi:5-methylcytosine-specific restriction endonuclease McrA